MTNTQAPMIAVLLAVYGWIVAVICLLGWIWAEKQWRRALRREAELISLIAQDAAMRPSLAALKASKIVAPLLVIALAWGCAGPTAPTETLHLTFAAAPGCQPGEIPPAPSTYPAVWIQSGGDLFTAGWTNGVTLEFRQFGQRFLVCRVIATAKS